MKRPLFIILLLQQQAEIIIGTRDEYDAMENRKDGRNQETVQNLFGKSAELIVIKHGVDGSYAYVKSGDVLQ